MYAKSYILLIIITLSSISCENENINPHGYWVNIFRVNYTTYTSGDPDIANMIDGYFIDTFPLREILYFNRDTMISTRFNETVYHGYTEDVLSFKLGKDSMSVKLEDKETYLDYSYSDDKVLVLGFEVNANSKCKDHYICLEEFGMAKKKKEINLFLVSNPITLGKREDKIELAPAHWHHMGEFIQDSIEADYGYGNDWYFYSLGKELFVVIGKELIHVSDFDNKKIVGFTYNRRTCEIEIAKSDYEDKFNVEYLIGNWINQKMPSAINENKRIQKLEINDNTIIVTTKELTDTLVWRLNKYKNKILLDHDSHEYGKYWKIQELKKGRLILKLKRGKSNSYKSDIEILTLERE